ncbi:oxidoreductase-like protein [Leishmania tarentolae]|uniref:Oxidoreductase-like protein n=1 Tax=Leishmania tarentolae TaxID=5689 RepID=A0A640KM17_LEITA|nr:oxidoreductase-like protein [Leishmania tarentolae]
MSPEHPCTREGLCGPRSIPSSSPSSFSPGAAAMRDSFWKCRTNASPSKKKKGEGVISRQGEGREVRTTAYRPAFLDSQGRTVQSSSPIRIHAYENLNAHPNTHSRGNMSTSTPRVGFLGAANIAWCAWTGVHANNMRVTRVGCRDVERGRNFVERVCNALKIDEASAPAVCSYDELVSAEDVDVVYIAIPVKVRDHWIRACIQHKKHVIGEKPPASDAEMLRSWIEALDRQNLLYMDGTMLSHGERVKNVCAAVKQMGGPIKHIFANVTLGGDEAFLENDIRTNPELEPHGALGDLGWYCIRYVLHLMDFQMPTEVSGRILKQNKQGAIISFTGDMTFEVAGGVALASFFVSFEAAFEQTLHITTTEGTLRLDDICWPITNRPETEYCEVHSSSCGNVCESHNHGAEVKHTVEGDAPDSQCTGLWGDVTRILYADGDGDARRFKAKEESSRYWAIVSWKTQAVMDKVLESALVGRSDAPTV